jgi:aryl-alcohol dehydrogenase-like predicted oxidoreductase
MTFGGQVSEEDSIRMVDYCLEQGINFFDTANVYNGGRSETILGKALSGRRHQVVLATKAGGKAGEEPDDIGLSRPALRKAIDMSLKRLQTDYLDFYYLHLPDRSTRIEETLATMNDLVREGKVRFPASSNYASWQILQMLWHCENHGYTPPATAQQMYNLLARGIEQEHLAFCREYRIGLVIYNPLAGGFLSGKHRAPEQPLPGTRFDGNKLYQDRYWHGQYFSALQELTGVAQRAGISLIALSFRWLLCQPLVDSIIIGATRMEHLSENIAATRERGLPEAVISECDAIWEQLRGITPRYNR